MNTIFSPSHRHSPLPIVIVLLISFLLGLSLSAQPTRKYVSQTFRGTRVINGHSVEMLNDGELDFLISHRFGRLSGGAYELFGMDQATIRFGLEYGFKNWLNVGVGRSSYGKHYDGYVKLRLLRQGREGGFPFTVNYFGSAAINTLKSLDPELVVPIQSRPSYTHQLLIARKWGEKFSIQLMPTLIHYNLVDSNTLPNDVMALGAAVRYAISKNVAILGEYYYTLPGHLAPDKQNSIALGVDINTGSHVFQLHLTNSQAMIEKSFIGETTGNWLKGDIHVGFNISRIFKLKGRRY